MVELKKKGYSFFSIAFILTFSNVFGKLLGFIRDILVSSAYGLNDRTDAFFLAITIPTTILGVFTSSSDSAIIPQYNRILLQKGRKDADENFSNIANIIFLIGIIVTVLIYFFPEIVIKFFAPGFNQQQNEYGVFYLKIFSIMGILHIIYCFFSAYNTKYREIIVRSFLIFITNIFVIIAVVFFPDPKMFSISLAYLFGSIVCAILPIIAAMWLGYRHVWKINLKNNYFVEFLKNFFPIMGTALIFDLNLFVDRFLASGLGEGSISALNYASRITSLFDGMMVIGIGVVILPLFSQLNNEKKYSTLKKISTKIVNSALMFLAPLVVIAIINSEAIISIIYQRGNFEYEDVLMVSSIFKIYAVLILSFPLETLLAKILHSFENTKIPLYINCIGIIINIGLSVWLALEVGLVGLAIGTAIASLLNCIMLLIYCSSEYKLFLLKSVFLFLLKTIFSLSALIVVNVLFMYYVHINNQILKFILNSGFSLGIYFVFLKIVRCEELNYIIRLINKKIKN